MRICIVGCGAVGSLFAANLATLDDVEVWAFDLDGAHVDAINENGLQLIGAGEVAGRPRRRATRPSCPPCEFGIVATKAMHTEPAIAATAHAFAGGAVASVQNGVGNEEAIARARRARDPRHDVPRGEDPRARCRAVGREGRHDVRPVRAASRARSTRSSALADACTRAGMPTHAVADARPAQWRKVIFNAATNPIGALTGLTHGRVCEGPDLRALVSGLVDEGKAVAAAQGIVLDADPEELIDHAARPDVAYGHKASMLQDVEARRPTEIDYLNGGIARFGRELGVPTPLNDAVTALIKGVETSWEAPRSEWRQSSNAAIRTSAPRWPSTISTRLIVAGSEYTGFEGPVTYLSGFQIVHRYAYVVVPADGDPFDRLPERGALRRRARDGADRAGVRRPARRRIAEQAREAGWRRDRRLRARLHHVRPRLSAARGIELVPFDVEFDLARAVKSDAELESVRDSVRINERGFEIFSRPLRAGTIGSRGDGRGGGTSSSPQGCGRLTMNMVLTGPGRQGTAGVQDRAQGRAARRLHAAVARDRGAGDALGRGVAGDRRGEDGSGASDAGDDGRLRRVLRDREGRDAGRGDRATMSTGPWRRASSTAATSSVTSRPLDRDDDDRASRRSARASTPSSREHGLLDASPRDRARRRRLPLHAGHVARHRRRRRSARRLPMKIFVKEHDGRARLGEDGVARCSWGAASPSTAPTTTRVGLSGHRRPAAVREALLSRGSRPGSRG